MKKPLISISLLSCFMILGCGLKEDSMHDLSVKVDGNVANEMFTTANRAYESGDFQLAIQLFERVRAIEERLANDNPNNVEFKQRLAETIRTIGNVKRESGQLLESLEEYQNVVAMLQPLAEQFPQNETIQMQLCDTLGKIGVVLTEIGEIDESLEYLDKALAIQKQIAVQKTGSFDERLSLAECYNNVGFAHLENGNVENSAKALRSALTIYEDMEVQSNLPQKYWSSYTIVLMNFGRLKGENENLVEARKFFNKSVAILEKLISENPDSVDYLNKLGSNYKNLGRTLEIEDTAAAVVQYGKSIATIKKVISLSPGNSKARIHLCYAYWDRAQLMESLSQYEQAVGDWQNALEHCPEQLKPDMTTRLERAKAKKDSDDDQQPNTSDKKIGAESS